MRPLRAIVPSTSRHDHASSANTPYDHRGAMGRLSIGFSAPVLGLLHPSQSGLGQTEVVNDGEEDDTDTEPQWRDLAANRPGQAARKVALERRQAAPVKTFIARLLRLHSNERAWR